ncbi:MAG: hypothetical protein WB996_12270 [Ignavibacteriaceae bacterium]
MKSGFLYLTILSIIVLSTLTFSQDTTQHKSIFESSLHHTGSGMKYWYDKKQGGLELITGVRYSDLSCKNCHIGSCDVCHKVEKDGKGFYSTAAAKKKDLCFNCHEGIASIRKINEENETPDVHEEMGLECLDCHSISDVHGDGAEFTSLNDPGAISAKCENCHDSISKNVSHYIHRNKVDCKGCHTREVVSCTNSQLETMIKEGKRVTQQVSGWEFLINYNGLVTSATIQTYVGPGNKTFIKFTPQFSHSIRGDGKKCEECHNNPNVNEMKSGSMNLTWLENGKLEQAHGVIPVTEGVDYNTVFQKYENGKWVPINNPEKPIVQFAGYGSPLTKKQVKRLQGKWKTRVK